jgi:hypothetical protein
MATTTTTIMKMMGPMVMNEDRIMSDDRFNEEGAR